MLWAEGETLQASVFGEHLVLRRRIEARVGESRLTIADEVENVGWDRTPHMVLYHVNVGFPVASEGSEVLVPARSVEARGELIELDPGEKRSYDLELGALDGEAEIERFAARVGALV